MTAGMPDYQSIVRPKFGGAKCKSGTKYVDANIITDIVDVEGRGIVYGGVLWLDYLTTQANSIVVLTVDKSVLSDLSFVRLSEFCIDAPGKYSLIINLFDHVNYVYSVSVGFGITFEDGIGLSYDEKHGDQPTVHYRLVYALL